MTRRHEGTLDNGDKIIHIRAKGGRALCGRHLSGTVALTKTSRRKISCEACADLEKNKSVGSKSSVDLPSRV